MNKKGQYLLPFFYIILISTSLLGNSFITDIGTFTLDGQQEAIIQKDPSDQLFAANAAVMAVGIAINSN